MPSRYFVRPADLKGYSPANHLGTTNLRMIGAENVGARNIEMIHGTIEPGPGHGALPHAHPGIEQIVYVLEGRAHAEVAGETAEVGPGDVCYFPPDIPHVFTAIGTDLVKVLVIYTPPYEENPARAIR